MGLSKTKIKSTNGQYYWRVKIDIKGRQPEYVFFRDYKMYLKPKGIHQQKSNEEHKKRFEAEYEALRRDVIDGNHDSYSSKGKSLLMEHVEWVAKQRGTSDKNRQLYETVKKHLQNYTLEFSGSDDIMLKNISYDYCLGFKTYLANTKSFRDGVTPLGRTSQNTYFIRFCVIMNDAVKRKLIRDTPTKDITPPELGERKITYLTADEIQQLHDTPCEDETLKNAFLFGYYTGLRKGDIESMTWKNLPLVNGVRRIDILTGKKKVVLNSKLNDKALELLPHPPRGLDDKVFVGFRYDGARNAKLKIWMLQAGIQKDGITSHTARHSFAVNKLDKGVTMYQLAKLMAHDSSRTTERYYAQFDTSSLDSLADL